MDNLILMQMTYTWNWVFTKILFHRKILVLLKFKIFWRSMIIFPMQPLHTEFFWLFVNCCIDRAKLFKLKSLKSYLRSTMTRERLNTLTVIAVKGDILEMIDYEYIIEDFISKNTKILTIFKWILCTRYNTKFTPLW